MKITLIATLCSTAIAVSTLQAAAATRHVHHREQATTTATEQVRNAHAAISAPDFYVRGYDADGFARGNAEAAPAGE